MQKKVFYSILLCGVFVFILCGFCVQPLTVYADTTDGVSSVSTDEGDSGDVLGWFSPQDSDGGESIYGEDQTDVAIAWSDTKSASAEKKFGMMFLGLLLIAGVTGIILYCSRCGKREVLAGLLQDFDQQYAEYKRYYAYCVEEYLRIERQGNANQQHAVSAMRDDMARLYNKMLEMKRTRDGICGQNFRQGKRTMYADQNVVKELCRNERQYQKRMERYLTTLREIRG